MDLIASNTLKYTKNPFLWLRQLLGELFVENAPSHETESLPVYLVHVHWIRVWKSLVCHQFVEFRSTLAIPEKRIFAQKAIASVCVHHSEVTRRSFTTAFVSIVRSRSFTRKALEPQRHRGFPLCGSVLAVGQSTLLLPTTKGWEKINVL
jgi:hypothetical protein